MRRLVLVEVQNLACARGGRTVFRNLNLRVGTGEVLALEGPNGAGKTSTLRVLAGLLPQAEGAIHFKGDSGAIAADGDRRKSFIAWLGHQDAIKAQLTVAENADFIAALFGAGANARAVLERVGLEALAPWPAHTLSAGQRRRLALASLILSGRPLWLLDEPLAALDLAGRVLVQTLVHEHCASGGIAIIATHESLPFVSARVTLAAP